ncbi:uncharacterized protein LOC113648611 isoform X2 [Tachysurus fulvidraco]|uniref:uncharacterized protein LOC113648611 isoform X2 n=1 Tax=Tachysurus fulvidraco TaxID=1234273 RepID=UPI001FEE4BFD|nr:uncharacterized protein LOC113648611 isoform X2 [Tachysurus fulvidraco]XP_047674491.1 uncharacterized protein LOC113648611 isoform X2 [Tachysurus fulvidraco]
MLLFSCLILNFIALVSVGHFVKIRRNESGTLPCKRRCPGLVRWVMSHSRDVVVAQCDQTSCSSEAGYDMSHSLYLKADLSLTITAADYHQRSWYTCQCDGKDVCDVRLSVERVNFSKALEPGDSLTMDLLISERVKITFNRSHDDGTQSSVTLCTVEGHEVVCNPEYKKRTSFHSSFSLTDLKESDCGVYTVWDTENDEIISTYTVTLKGKNRPPSLQGGESCSLLVAVVFISGFVFGVLVHRFVYPWVIQKISNCFNRAKRKNSKRSECNQTTAEENSAELVQLKVSPVGS